MDAKKRRIWLGCLTVGHIVVWFMFSLQFSRWWHVEEPLFILHVTQTCLLGIWIGLRACSWPWRLASVVYGLGWLRVVSEPGEHFMLEGNSFILIVAVLMLICRGFVVRPELSDQRLAKSPTRILQFTILQIIVFTVIVAVCLAFRNLILEALEFLHVFNTRQVDSLLDFILIAIFIFTVPSFLAIWSALGKGHPGFRLGISCLLNFVLLIFIGLSYSVFDFRWRILTEALLYTFPIVVIFLSLLVVRSCGYRLVRVRWEWPGQDSDEPIENDTDETVD